MSRAVRYFSALAVTAFLTWGLTAGTVLIQRQVRTEVPDYFRCDAGRDIRQGSCYKWLPAGGWPFAFLYDRPGTSVIGRLGPEDEFKHQWFLADMAILGALPAVGVSVFLARRRKPWKPSEPSGLFPNRP